jgi:hypothetical protein
MQMGFVIGSKENDEVRWDRIIEGGGPEAEGEMTCDCNGEWFYRGLRTDKLSVLPTL